MDRATRQLNFMLTLIAMMAAIMLASVQFACASDGDVDISGEPTNLRWNAYRPYRAEWEWTEATEGAKLEQLGVTVNYYETPNGAIADSYPHPNFHLDKTYCDFNTGDDDNFFSEHQEGYYSFSLMAHYSDGTIKNVESDRVHYRKIDYVVNVINADGTPYDGSAPDRNDYFSIDQENDAHYTIIADSVTILPADIKVRARIIVNQPGFKASGYTFEPTPVDLESGDEKASFTLDQNYKMTFTIQKDESTVPVTIDFGEGHENVATKTAEDIENPYYSWHTAYDTDVSGSNVTINDWPKATKVKDLKEIIADHIEVACREEDKGFVYDNNDCFRDGKIGLKPITGYSSKQEYLNEKAADASADIPDEGVTLYVLWDKLVTEASFNIEIPKCGTEVSIGDGGLQTPTPVVTEADGSKIMFDREVGSNWMQDLTNKYSDTMKGGESYIAKFSISEPFGYYFYHDSEDNPPVVKVNGKVVAEDAGHTIFAPITAVHVWGEGVITKKPTQTENGVRTYTCSECGATKTESIDKLAPDTTPGTDVKPSTGVKVVYDKNLPRVKIRKPARLKKAVRVKWTKLSAKKRKKCGGIEIQIKGPGNKNKTRLIKAGKKLSSKKIKKLKNKKSYHVRVRTYKYVGKVKHVGKWSKYWKVKTK